MKKVISLVILFSFHYVLLFDSSILMKDVIPSKKIMEEITTRCDNLKTCEDNEIKAYRYFTNLYTDENKDTITNCIMLYRKKGFYKAKEAGCTSKLDNNRIRHNLQVVGTIDLLLAVIYIIGSMNKTRKCPQCAKKNEN